MKERKLIQGCACRRGIKNDVNRRLSAHRHEELSHQPSTLAEQQRAQGRIKFVIEKDSGAEVMLAAPLTANEKGKEIRILSNLLEIK